MKIFWKAQEVLYNFNAQPKAQFLEFLSENLVARLKVATILMLLNLTSAQGFANILSYKNPIEVLLVVLESLLRALQLLIYL